MKTLHISKLPCNYTKVLSKVPVIDSYDFYDELGFFISPEMELKIKLEGIYK